MKGKNDFEKVRIFKSQHLIKATYGYDKKEPKKKHVECKFYNASFAGMFKRGVRRIERHHP